MLQVFWYQFRDLRKFATKFQDYCKFFRFIFVQFCFLDMGWSKFLDLFGTGRTFSIKLNGSILTWPKSRKKNTKRSKNQKMCFKRRKECPKVYDMDTPVENTLILLLKSVQKNYRTSLPERAKTTGSTAMQIFQAKGQFLGKFYSRAILAIFCKTGRATNFGGKIGGRATSKYRPSFYTFDVPIDVTFTKNVTIREHFRLQYRRAYIRAGHYFNKTVIWAIFPQKIRVL